GSKAQCCPSDDGLFSRIVRGEEQQWRVWEDSEHVAFLTPYPNSPGLTVLVPRKPLPSDIFKLEEADYNALILATYKVARLLEEAMTARGVALIFEGFEIDYTHKILVLSGSTMLWFVLFLLYCLYI
uniref:HIT domain-containing protein n=1 Tax=Myripristis murdjan TaxID=586833 RepID=A0A667YN98_9TELE